MNRTFFFLQNDININDFDEGVLILEPFFWGNVILKSCSFCIKSQWHVWGREEFLWVAPPDYTAAKLYIRNASLYYSCWLCFTKQELTIYPGKPHNGKFSVHKLWLLRYKDKSWKWHCLRKTATESKRLHQNERSWCHLAGKRISYAIMHTTFAFCPSFSWNYWS